MRHQAGRGRRGGGDLARHLLRHPDLVPRVDLASRLDLVRHLDLVHRPRPT